MKLENKRLRNFCFFPEMNPNSKSIIENKILSDLTIGFFIHL